MLDTRSPLLENGLQKRKFHFAPFLVFSCILLACFILFQPFFSQSELAVAAKDEEPPSKLQRKDADPNLPQFAKGADSPGRPIVVITDIGRDIDDTLAMAVLSGFVKKGKANPVGFVATGWDEPTVQHRMGLLRWWVSRVGGMNDPLITGCVSGSNDNGVTLPKGATPDTDFKADLCETAAQMIIEQSEKYDGQLEVFAIAGLGAMKTVIEKRPDIKLKALWIQGQWQEGESRIRPEFKAYNLQIDEDASNVVFEALQQRVPLRLLGKWSAYETLIMVDDFIEFDKIDPSSDILETALKQLNKFRLEKPWLMWYLYPGKWNTNPAYAVGNKGAKPLPMKEADAVQAMGKPYPDDQTWCSQLTYISMPYDPNLILWAFSDADLFTPREIGDDELKHQVVGNDANDPGVKDADVTKGALVNVIKEGLQGATQTPSDGSKKPASLCPDIAARAQNASPQQAAANAAAQQQAAQQTAANSASQPQAAPIIPPTSKTEKSKS